MANIDNARIPVMFVQTKSEFIGLLSSRFCPRTQGVRVSGSIAPFGMQVKHPGAVQPCVSMGKPSARHSDSGLDGVGCGQGTYSVSLCFS
jgi:hypothetical protein